MKRPTLNIQTSLKVDDSKEIKSPNASISPSENDFFNKISGLDAHSVLDFRGEDMSASTAKESASVSSPVSAANIRLSISQETPTVSPFKDARPNFIKKVLALLFLQMAMTVLSIGLTFIPNIGVAEFMRTNKGAIIAAGIITIACLIILACKRDACRKVPRNYLLLFIFTFGMSYILGSVSACTSGNVVLYAGICTLVIVIAISLYACFTKNNLTNSGMGIVTFLSAALLAVIISVVWPDHILTAFYSAVAACIFGFHLAFDIQKLAGKYENQYSLDDYILASLDIYIDIIQIFIALVNIIRRLVPTA